MSKIAKQIAKTHSGNETEALVKKYDKICEHAKDRQEPKTNKDSALWADSKDWDEEDKRHNLGIYRLYFYPSKKYADRFDLIDWSQ